MRIMDLRPGDLLKSPTFPEGPDADEESPTWGVFIGHIDNSPLYKSLCMFIWRLSDDGYSFDSMSPMQAISPHDLVPTTVDQRRQNLQWAVGMYGAEKPNVM